MSPHSQVSPAAASARLDDHCFKLRLGSPIAAGAVKIEPKSIIKNSKVGLSAIKQKSGNMFGSNNKIDVSKDDAPTSRRDTFKKNTSTNRSSSRRGLGLGGSFRAEQSVQNLLSQVPLAIKEENEKIGKKSSNQGWLSRIYRKRNKRKMQETCSDSGFIRHAPTADMTGVEERYTRLCATISSQIYCVKTFGDFTLESAEFFVDDSQPEVVWFEDHGIFAETTPPIAAVIVDKKMIIAWRGSTTPMDWIHDFVIAPVTSSRWQHVSPNIRVHGAFYFTAENDLSQKQDTILDIIESKNIEELIFTGHSLGGAVANVAHIMIAGERKKKQTEWMRSETLRNLTIRSIAFSAPMTAILVDESDKAAREFLEETVGNSSCNIVYGMDPVPRGYGHLDFINDMMEDTINEAMEDMGWFRKRAANVVSRFYYGRRVRLAVDDYYRDQANKYENITKVARLYRHFGRIINYCDSDSKPFVCEDKGPLHQSSSGDETRLFRHIEYVHPAEADSKKATIATVAAKNHTFLVNGPGLAFKVEEAQ